MIKASRKDMGSWPSVHGRMQKKTVFTIKGVQYFVSVDETICLLEGDEVRRKLELIQLRAQDIEIDQLEISDV